ncbi:MAG: glycoside hydrolase family 92 protein, partial [Clostridia bacterium]|nr:glycoside hydrolase family 92 protein [Clostridia bacterium]
ATRAAIDPGSGFWIGNQHDIHTPYLFNDAGRPDLTQKWVRWTLNNKFSTDTDGLDGNDDGGTLSAWYVFSALGFYPIAGTEKYYLGSPNINSAVIKLENGKELRITVNNNSDKNIYVSEITFHGEKYDNTQFSHQMIENGGEIIFEMSSIPKA